MSVDDHEVLDQLLSEGPIVMFWTVVHGPPTDADAASQRTSVDYVSPSMEKVFGHPRQSVAGPVEWMSLIHPDDRAEVSAIRQRAIETDEWPTRSVYRFRHADGTWRWVESNVNLVRGGPDRLVGFVTDITDRYESEQALLERSKQLTAMFDGAPAQIYAKGLDGRYLLCNRNVLAMWGLDAADVIGRTDHELWPEFADSYRANDVRVAEEGTASAVEEIVTIDGELVTFLSLKFPLRDEDGVIYGTAGVSADITDRAREVTELVSAMEQADRANAAKNDFLSRMSHELRTPLNSILGFSQLLDMSTLTPDDQSSVDHILRAGKHLLTLINEVLEITRIESGTLTLSIEPVDLRQTIVDAVGLIGPAARERSISITTRLPEAAGFIAADRQRTIQVLLNLLSNAVKYDAPGGSVTVTAAPSEDGRMRISVADDGPGIAIEDQASVFDPFERLESTRSTAEGTGVGLTLTKQLVGLMGGEIGVESAPGQGCTFWFELATCPGPDAQAIEPAPESRGGHEDLVATVLCIEDNPANLRLVERVIGFRPGVRFLSAMTGTIGLAQAREHVPDLILLDLHLPDMYGMDVLLELRSDPRTADISTYILTADATDHRRAKAKEAGADGYLTKPMDVQELLAAVDSIANR